MSYIDHDEDASRTYRTGLLGWLDLDEASRELGCTEEHTIILARAGAICWTRWRSEVVVSEHSIRTRLQRQAKARARAAEKAARKVAA